MSQNNRACAKGILSSCNLTVTCADGTRRYIPCLAECSSSEVEGSEMTSPIESVEQSAQADRNGQSSQHPINGSKGRNSLRTSHSKSTTKYRRSSPRSTNFVEGGESISSSSRQNKNNSPDILRTTEERDDCNDNTYTEILDRFNSLKDRMCRSPERGDKCFTTSSCFILEEEKQVFKTCPDNEETPSSLSKHCRGTERISTTKVSSGLCNYIKETVVEQSTLTRYGILTKTRHIIEKHGEDAIAEYEESNRMSAQDQIGKQNTLDASPKTPSKRGSGSAANKSKRTSGPPSPKRGKKNRLSKAEEHSTSLSSRSDASKIEDLSRAQPTQAIPTREITNDINDETMPSLVNTTVDPSNLSNQPQKEISSDTEGQNSSQLSGQEIPPTEKQKTSRSKKGDKTRARKSKETTDDINEESMPSLVNTTTDLSSPLSQRNSRETTVDLNKETMPSLVNTTVDRASSPILSPRRVLSSPEEQSSPQLSRQAMPQTEKQRTSRSRTGSKTSPRNSRETTDNLNEESMPSLVNTTGGRSSLPTGNKTLPRNSRETTDDLNEESMPSLVNSTGGRSSFPNRSQNETMSKAEKQRSTRNSRKSISSSENQSSSQLPRQRVSEAENQRPRYSRQSISKTEDQSLSKPTKRVGSKEMTDDLNEESMPSLASTTANRSSNSNRSQGREKQNKSQKVQKVPSGETADNLSQESMPTLNDTSVGSGNQTHDPLKCCPCGCQRCATDIGESLSLPANRRDPETISTIVTEDDDGRKRVDYYLVGELLQNRSAAEATSGVGNSEQLTDITPPTHYEEQNSSFYDDPPPLSSTAYPNKGKTDNQEELQLENVSSLAYESSTVNESSSVEHIENISAPSFQNLADKSSQLQTANVSEERRSELIAEITIPDEFNRELPEPSGTEKSNSQKNRRKRDTKENLDRYTEENIADITPPEFDTSSEGHISERGQRENINEDIQNISEPSGMSSLRNEERTNETNDGLRIDDETPPTDMEPSSSFHTSKQGYIVSSVDDNSRRNSRRMQSTQLLKSIMVPLIYFQPQSACQATCRCGEPPQYCQAPCPIQIGGCPTLPLNFIPISTQYCESSEEDEDYQCEIQDEEEEEEDASPRLMKTTKNGKKNRRSSSGEDCTPKRSCCNEGFSDASIPYGSHMMSPLQEQQKSHSTFSSRTLIGNSISNIPSMHSKHSHVLAEVKIEDLDCNQSAIMKDAIKNEHCELYILRRVQNFVENCRPSAENVSPIKRDSYTDPLKNVSISCDCTCTNSSLIRELQNSRDGNSNLSSTLCIENTSITSSLCGSNTAIQEHKRSQAEEILRPHMKSTTSRSKNSKLLAEVIFDGLNCDKPVFIEREIENDHNGAYTRRDGNTLEKSYNQSLDQSAANTSHMKNVSFSCHCNCSSSSLVQEQDKNCGSSLNILCTENNSSITPSYGSNRMSLDAIHQSKTSLPNVSCSCTCVCPVTFQGHHKRQDQHSNKSIVCDCTCTSPVPSQGHQNGRDEDCIPSIDQRAKQHSYMHRDSYTDQCSNKSSVCDCTCTITSPSQKHQNGQDEDCIPTSDHNAYEHSHSHRDFSTDQHSNKSIVCDCTCTSAVSSHSHQKGPDEDCIPSSDHKGNEHSHMHRDSCTEQPSNKSIACDCTCSISCPVQSHQKGQDEDCTSSTDRRANAHFYMHQDSCTDQHSNKSIACDCTCTSPVPNQGHETVQDENCRSSSDQKTNEHSHMHRDSCTDQHSNKSIVCDCTCEISSPVPSHQKGQDEDCSPSFHHHSDKSIQCDCICTSECSISGHQKESSKDSSKEKCASKILKLIENCLQNQVDDDCTCESNECLESEQNARPVPHVLQPIVLPVLIYQPRPPTCFDCYNPQQPAICSGYTTCQCCDPRACCIPNRPSYEVDYCDPQCSTYSCPCQCYDQQSICSYSMPTCPPEFCCPRPAPACQTPFPCCNPRPCCYMQQCQPFCLPPVTLQFSNNGEKCSSHEKKSKDKKHKGKKNC